MIRKSWEPTKPDDVSVLNNCGTELVASASSGDSPKKGLWLLATAGGLALVVLILVLLAVVFGGTTEPSNAGQTTAPQPEQAQPQAVVAGEPSAYRGRETPHQRQEEERQQQAWFLPDPPPPVAMSKISGIWWTEYDPAKDEKTMAEHKEFAFVEDFDEASTPSTAKLSMSNGASLVVKCVMQWQPMGPTGTKLDGNYEEGQCSELPESHWIRVMLSDGVTKPGAGHWFMTYTDGTVSEPAHSGFGVSKICYPNGTCMTYQEAERDKARRGDD
jgi:hypothetical protein